MNQQQKSELRAGVLQGAAIAALFAVIAAPIVWWVRAPDAPPHAASASAPAAVARVDFGAVSAPPDVRAVAGWAVASRDHAGASFAVVDKRRTHLYVFDGAGKLLGQTSVLLGYAPGDDSVPGIGQRPIEQVRPEERTTPAGRFDAVSGRNLLQEDVVWVDYASAVSMHRVRATDPRERRLERLASATSDDNRISYGCINVPAAFFDGVVWPALGSRRRAVVYVLPEVKSLQQVFPAASAV
jgi:hypothetical protein